MYSALGKYLLENSSLNIFYSQCRRKACQMKLFDLDDKHLK